MSRFLPPLALLLLLAGCASAPPLPACGAPGTLGTTCGMHAIPVPQVPATPIEYEISFPRAEHHEAEVSVTVRGLGTSPLEMRMSRASPGRYALHEFAKNVYGVHATDGDGRALEVRRPDPHGWIVAGHDGTVVFRYTLFADRTDGTYSGIDNTHAHLNMPATFAWARGLEQRPISITFHPPDPAHRVATQLAPTEDPVRFNAPDLYYFLDSPTEISDFDLRSWTIESGGEQRTVRLAVHHLGTEQEMDAFAAMVRPVVAEEIAVFGEAPDFDFGTYTFIADYLPWVSGDGMEHRNSTILTSTRPLSTGALGNLGTVSHEFFHAWNVERLRPRSLEPFDFEEANMSGELWFAEGFTSYYTPVFIVRAGLMGLDDYAANLAGTLNTVINAPGRRYFSPVEMSFQAPFVDAAVSVDPTNRVNTFISYYTWGAALGLGLDLLLRDGYDLTLDGYMRALWDGLGRDERPYTRDDLRDALGRYTGDAGFANEFFRGYVEGREAIDYAPLLARAGLLLRAASPGAAWMGDARLRLEKGAIVVESPTLVGTPLYEAGVERGDTILAIGGVVPASDEELAALLADYRPGGVLEIEFEQRGERRTVGLTLREDPRLEVTTYESAGLDVTDEIRAFRADWLGGRGR
jgi:predicted metalloprotease with PDZ domain